MHYIIYKITNKINNKEYIGMHKTNNLDDGYMGSGKLILRAIKKYGIENFSKEILFVFDNEQDMKNKEKDLITEEYCLRNDTYNLCNGGHGGFGYINRIGLNVKGLCIARENAKKKWQEDEIYRTKTYDMLSKNRNKKLKIRFDWLGKKHRPESIEKMKKSAVGKQQGEKNSQFGTCWITNGSENKKIKKEDLDIWIELGYYKGRI